MKGIRNAVIICAVFYFILWLLFKVAEFGGMR